MGKSCQLVLMNYPKEELKKRNKSKSKYKKLKDEVGMAGSKITQTRFVVVIITLISLCIPTLAF